MEKKQYGDILLILFFHICIIFLTACGKETEQHSGTADLDAWVGYYSCCVESENAGSIAMDLLIYKEDHQYLGYLSMEGHEQEGEWAYTYPQSRILTEVRETDNGIAVYYTEDVSEDPKEAYFGSYQSGDLLFSLKSDYDGIITSWGEMKLDHSDAVQVFHRENELLSMQLQNQEDAERFLTARGIEADEDAYYAYYNEEGMLQLKLYFNPSAQVGTGIFYGKSGDEKIICGFGIESFDQEPQEVDEWREAAIDGGAEFWNREYDVQDYEEFTEYNEKGQMTSYRRTGTIDWLTDSEYPEEHTIIEYKYFYRDNGTLERKEKFYNNFLFGTYRCTETEYYDTMERLVYTNAYITHGYLEDYYIYKANKKDPEYCLTLDHMGRDAWVWSFIKM